jgi:4-alpha-glucanotransferase
MNMHAVFADSLRPIGKSAAFMKLTFRLRYRSQFGQSLWLAGSHPALGGGTIEKAIPLVYLNEEIWQATVELPPDTASRPITYDYILRNADGSSVTDWGRDRALIPSEFGRNGLLVMDSWNNAGAAENVFYTEPFKNVLPTGNFTGVHSPAPASPTHTFRVKAPLLGEGQTLCLLGDGAALGNWNAARPVLLNRLADQNDFSAKLDLRSQSFPFAYKYGVFDTGKNVLVRYEDGANRVLDTFAAPNGQTLVNDGFVRLPVETWKGAGVAIPVFSLRSETSFGVGEFEDLKLLADWCRRAGLKMIQILPVNDTSATHTWLDSYPYAAISAFALHPIYLNLNRVATGRNKSLLKLLEPERRRLNALDTVDYDAVLKAKLDFVRRIFPAQKARTFASKGYQIFFSQNRDWLAPYAAFCHLRDKYGTSDFNQWPAFRHYHPEEIAGLAAENSLAHDDIALNYFVQYHLHLQLKEAAAHAHNLGIILKGDIPIGVYRHGCDVWQQPELYHLEVQAGCPPDAFAVKGQNWGFPTYNWPRMKADGFAWWKRRFEQMAGYFDAFRIDHILGFFRIWSIPAHAVEGILGYFVPAIPVDVPEFGSRGIRFDYDRFTKPYITDVVLKDIFGNAWESVKHQFLVPASAGNYSLKPEFATQRQVERHFAQLEKSERNRAIREGLYDLISNVILFEDGNSRGQRFHFRFAMENTSAFKSLEPQTQARLRELYLDYFFRRQDNFWQQEAMQKLPALKRVSNMLVCGEDLGFVPGCVPEVMKQLGLLSLEVQRMPKDLHREFSRPQDAPYLSVVTPSSHDMSTIRGWWEEDAQRTQKFYNQELGRPGGAPRHCETGINRAIVDQHLASPAMWSIFQLQDLLGMDEKLRREDFAAERINVPAIPNYYWRYRMHLSLETLLAADAFNQELRRHIEENGR